LAALLAGLLLAAAVPTPALAEDENPWSVWATQLGDRGTKAEIPIVAIITLPAMLVITPFWLGGLAYGKIAEMAGGGGEDDDGGGGGDEGGEDEGGEE
jgi:hypothetical protein